MRAMLKYELKAGENAIDIPGGLCGHHIDVVAGRLYLWTMVNTDKPVKAVKVFTAVTGEPLPENVTEYLGTALANGGGFVLHAFLME